MGTYETSKWQCLQERVALKPGQRHCMRCGGHGYHPINRNERITRFFPERCHGCEGTGRASV